MKLKLKLGSLVIAIMVVALTGIAVLLVKEMADISRKLSLQGIQYLANDQATYWKGQQDGRLDALHILADIMSGYEDIPAEARRDRFDEIMKGVIAANPFIIQLYSVWKPDALDGMDAKYVGRKGSNAIGQYAMTYTRETGELIGRATGDVDPSMAYFNGPNSKNDRVEQPFIRKIGDKELLMLRIMVPIVNPRTKETVGGVGYILDLSMIQPAVLEVMKNNPDIAALTIFSSDGFILGHMVPDRVGKKLRDAETIFGKHADAADSAVREGRRYALNTYSPVLKSNVELIILPFTIGTSNMTWSVMVVISEKLIMDPIRAATKYAAAVAALIIVLSAIIVFVVLSRVVITPIVRVVNSLRDISEGEGDLTQTIAVQSKDEVGDLARYFNKLMAKLHSTIKTTQKEAKSLSGTSASLLGLSENLLDASETTLNQSITVSRESEDTSENVQKIAGESERASATATELSAAVEQMGNNMNTMVEAVGEMHESFNKITTDSRESKKVAGVATEKVAGAMDVMDALARSAKEIWQFTDVIKSIAKKTNLLAINATVEAARAGEAGKGFAVVAGEVKQLATQSASNADDITSRVENIQKDTTAAIDAIKEISVIITKISESANSISESIERQIKVSDNLAATARDTNAGAQQVVAAVNDVANSIQIVAQNAGNAAEGAKNVSDSIGVIHGDAEKTNAYSSDLKEAANSLKVMAEDLDAIVSKFKT